MKSRSSSRRMPAVSFEPTGNRCTAGSWAQARAPAATTVFAVRYSERTGRAPPANVGFAGAESEPVNHPAAGAPSRLDRTGPLATMTDARAADKRVRRRRPVRLSQSKVVFSTAMLLCPKKAVGLTCQGASRFSGSHPIPRPIGYHRCQISELPDPFEVCEQPSRAGSGRRYEKDGFASVSDRGCHDERRT